MAGVSELDWKKCSNCFHTMTAFVVAEFKKLAHVDVEFVDHVNYRVLGSQDVFEYWNSAEFINSIKNTDFIVYIGYASGNRMPWHEIRKRVSNKVVSLLEIAFLDADWSLCFTNYPPGTIRNNVTTIIAPCSKNVYINVPKTKSILMDHWTGNMAANNWNTCTKDDIDWTHRISDWLSSVKDDYKICRMVRFGQQETDTVKPYESMLPHCYYGEFLDKTNDFETFVVTHADGYGYGVIDMAARGIRVISPPGFICPELVDAFGIHIFHNQDELVDIIKSPVDEHWNNCINKCTDYSDIVKIIDNKFQGWL
jgi:hypothetical protein